MRTEIDRQLSRYFSLYEIMEGTAIPREGHILNWKHFDEFNESEFKKICEFMDKIRELINYEFKSDTNPKREIGIEVVAGFRCHDWEILQGRSGNSRHTIAALDICPSGCSLQMKAQIIGWLHSRYKDRITGHQGGFAIKRPNIREGRAGFAHFDLRKEVARWEY